MLNSSKCLLFYQISSCVLRLFILQAFTTSLYIKVPCLAEGCSMSFFQKDFLPCIHRGFSDHIGHQSLSWIRGSSFYARFQYISLECLLPSTLSLVHQLRKLLFQSQKLGPQNLAHQRTAIYMNELWKSFLLSKAQLWLDKLNFLPSLNSFRARLYSSCGNQNPWTYRENYSESSLSFSHSCMYCYTISFYSKV